jgi:1-acyl-sn-glycerol-3-phosphate acyltransferase
MRWLDILWRVSATGFAFLCIFFGGGVLAVALQPMLALFPGDRRGRTQRAIHRLFGIYLKGLQRGGLVRLEIEGVEKLTKAQGCMVVANHPSLLDVVILMSLIPRAQCIVKHQLWDHRFLGRLMRQAGYISNALPGEEIIAACSASLERGESLIVFPEGTRSTPGRKLSLQRGFAHLATMTSAKILPVTITCEPPTLVKGEPWWHIPPHPPLFRLVVGETLDTDRFLQSATRSLATRRLVSHLGHYFEERLENV